MMSAVAAISGGRIDDEPAVVRKTADGVDEGHQRVGIVTVIDDDRRPAVTKRC